MNIARMLFVSLAAVLSLTGFICDKDDTPTGAPGPAGLTASSSSVTMLPGQERTVVISSGTAPYSLVSNSASSVVEATFSSPQLTLKALAAGSAAIMVRDASTPAKDITINVTVATSLSLPSAGSLSFSSTGGDVSINGVLSVGDVVLTGEGAGALQEFGRTSLVAYKVYSPTRVDLFEADFIYATSLVTGTYSYPSGGNKVQTIYIKDLNPQDTTVTPKFYIFSVANAQVTKAALNGFAGTFTATGVNVISSGTMDQISVTAGSFNVPMLVVGGNSEQMQTNEVRSMIGRLKERYLRK